MSSESKDKEQSSRRPPPAQDLIGRVHSVQDLEQENKALGELEDIKSDLLSLPRMLGDLEQALAVALQQVKETKKKIYEYQNPDGTE